VCRFRVSRTRSAAASAVLGGALSAVAFGAQAGTELASSTIVSILVVIGGGGVLGYCVLRWRPGPLYGGTAVLLLAVFAGVTALSAAWSIAPADTTQEAGRTFAYLVAFAAAVVGGRHFPRDAHVVAKAVALAGTIVCGWALATRIWPGSLGGDLFLTSRLGAPFDYWNALGGMAALAIPPTLWLAARRSQWRLAAALAYSAMGVLVLTILLTQSRGALAAAVVALLAWFILVPLRLRSVPAVVLPVLAATPVAAWALSHDQFTETFKSVPVSAQEAVASDFGLMTLAMCVFLALAGPVVLTIASDLSPSLRARRRVGVALAVLTAMVPVVAVGSVLVSDRGLGRTVSDRFEELTSETQAPPSGSSRLASASSSRGEYWRQAGEVFKRNRAVGTGANTFGLSRLPYRPDRRSAAHAHGFVAQTLSDLGLVGVAAAISALAAWLFAACRTLGWLPGRRRPDWTDERAALTALALCAVAFGLHSAIDWIWAIPGTAIGALVAAGFVAGRGPLPAATEVVEDPLPAVGRPGAGQLLAVGGMFTAAILCSWAIWQPNAAARANDRALLAIERGDYRGAERLAIEARDLDRYSPDPLFTRAEALAGRGRRVAAYRNLEVAVNEHPRDPDTWLRLAEFELRDLDLPQRALETVDAVRVFDPNSPRAIALRAAAERGVSQTASP